MNLLARFFFTWYVNFIRGGISIEEAYRELDKTVEAPKRIQHIYKYLETLEKAGFIGSDGKRFWVEDPLLRTALTSSSQ